MSHLLRWYARRFAEGSVVTIRSGCAKGLLWRRHKRYVNGYWLGQFELPVQEALRRELREGSVVFDVGANAGFFSLIASRLVGPSGKCFSFDPDPANIESIREQIRLNNIANWVAVQEAVSDKPGDVPFSRAVPGSSTGHLGEARRSEETIEVKVTTLDEAAVRFGPPDFIKMDIEGAEGEALRGASCLLRSARPSFLIELHNENAAGETRRIMEEAKYEVFSLRGARVSLDDVLPSHVLVWPE